MAQEALKDLINTDSGSTREINIPNIKKVVAENYNINLTKMDSKKRTQNIVLPRQIAMYLSREMTDSSLPVIGDAFGGRDHTTVMHAHNKITEKIEENQEFRKTISKLQKKITGSDSF